MTTTSTDQSDSAAGRSAHVSRGFAETLSGLEPTVIQLPDGTWKLRVIHELEEENRKLREALTKIDEIDSDSHGGYGSFSEIAREALTEEE